MSTAPLLSVLVAHGLAHPGQLPLPLVATLYLTAAGLVGIAVLIDRGSAPADETRGWGLPPALDGFASARVTLAVLRTVILAAFAATLIVALAAPDRPTVNPAWHLVLVVFWAGLVPLSLALGPVWRAVNPLRTVARILDGPVEANPTRPLPTRLGLWPAAGLLLGFAWLELVVPPRPSSLFLGVVVIAGAVVGGALWWGERWVDHADPFEAYARLLGNCAPVGRNAQGRLMLRSPRQTLATMTPPSGLIAIAAVVVGAAVFDGIVELQAWHTLRQPLGGTGQLALDTGALVASIAFVYGVLRLSTVRARFAVPAVVPLATGYALAHYLPVLLVDGQVVLAQLSDPLATGRDLLGTAGRELNPDVLPPTLLALLLLAALLGAHAAALLVARDRSRHLEARAARVAQLPFRIVVVASAVVAVGLRFSGAT